MADTAPYASPKVGMFRRSRLAAALASPAQTVARGVTQSTPTVSTGVQTSPQTADRPNKTLLNRLEELEVALDTAHAVNRHLNGEVEGLVMELDKLRREKQQYERHIEELAALLHKEKHKTAALVAQAQTRGSPTQPAAPAAETPVNSNPGLRPTEQPADSAHNAMSNGAEPLQLARQKSHAHSAALSHDMDSPADGEYAHEQSNAEAAAAQMCANGSVESQQEQGVSRNTQGNAQQADGGAADVQRQRSGDTAMADVTQLDDMSGSEQQDVGTQRHAGSAITDTEQRHAAESTAVAAAGGEPSGMTTSSTRSVADAWHMVDEASSMQSRMAEEAGPHIPAAPNGHVASRFAPPPAADAAGMEWIHDVRWDHLRSEAQAAGWLISPDELQLGPQIGEGAFGVSYRGIWRGVTVAVKCVRVQTVTEAETFIREVELLASLRHPNLLPFYGACLWPALHCWLVTEFMTGGTLHTWLYGTAHKQGTILMPQRPLHERLHMALDVAQGMEALEESDPPIVHRDLKPSNVFIDGAGRARVADFGLGRRLTAGCAADLTGETGTYMYMSPEMMRHELYDSKTDVYSWGVMLVELVLQRNPYEKLYLSPVQIALAVAEGKLHAADLLPHTTNPSVAALAAMCLEQEPDLRPTFGLIVQELTMAIDEVKLQANASQKGAFGRFFSRRLDSGKENEDS